MRLDDEGHRAVEVDEQLQIERGATVPQVLGADGVLLVPGREPGGEDSGAEGDHAAGDDSDELFHRGTPYSVGVTDAIQSARLTIPPRMPVETRRCRHPAGSGPGCCCSAVRGLSECPDGAFVAGWRDGRRAGCCAPALCGRGWRVTVRGTILELAFSDRDLWCSLRLLASLIRRPSSTIRSGWSSRPRRKP